MVTEYIYKDELDCVMVCMSGNVKKCSVLFLMHFCMHLHCFFQTPGYEITDQKLRV